MNIVNQQNQKIDLAVMCLHSFIQIYQKFVQYYHKPFYERLIAPQKCKSLVNRARLQNFIKTCNKNAFLLLQFNKRLAYIQFYKQTIFMNTVKRFFSKTSKVTTSKINRYDKQNEDLRIFQQFQSSILNISSKKTTARHELQQISNNSNQIANGSLLLSKNSRPSSAVNKRRMSASLIGGSQNNIEKNNEYLENQKIFISTCGQIKKQARKIHERPKTSLSLQRETDSYFIKKCNLAFDEFKPLPSDERISASRALSKYSLVPKNSSKSIFKVKKDRNAAPDYLSARKIVFQLKQKKQNSYAQKIKQNSYALRRLAKNIRYSDKQDYELKGWDYQ